MLNEHLTSAGTSIEHVDASLLFHIADLDATVLQHRDAELALTDVDSEDVIVIAPTSLASTYFLTQRPLSAIPVDGLSSAVRARIAAALEVPLDTFELIQIGKWNRDSANHSLAEFADA